MMQINSYPLPVITKEYGKHYCKSSFKRFLRGYFLYNLRVGCSIYWEEFAAKD